MANKYNYTVLLDNGHGSNTPGKHSPIIDFIKVDDFNRDYIINGRFREYAFTRKLASICKPMLEDLGINVKLVTPEEEDVSLGERVRRINRMVSESPSPIMLSLHADAAGNGDWMNARGMSFYTTRGQNNSDKLAEELYNSAEYYIGKNAMFYASYKDEKKQKMFRMDKSDGDKDMEAGFYIIKGANCPAVLAECFFQDNKSDIELLTNEYCLNIIAGAISYGVDRYFKKYKGKQ